MYETRLHRWSKFGYDWSKAAPCVAENEPIFFKHEYRRRTLMSRCDVIADVISVNNIFSDVTDLQ